MSTKRKIDVVVVRVGQQPKVETIFATLEAQQMLVGGLIEPIDLGEGLSLVVNEEGQINEENTHVWLACDPVSRQEIRITVFGDFYFARWDAKGEVQSVRLADMPKILDVLGVSLG